MMKTYDELLAERDALAVQIVAIISAVNGIRGKGKKSGFGFQSINDVKDERLAWMRLNNAINEAPEQQLAEIKAEAIEDANNELNDLIRSRVGKDYAQFIENCFDEYAAKIRKGGG